MNPFAGPQYLRYCFTENEIKYHNYRHDKETAYADMQTILACGYPSWVKEVYYCQICPGSPAFATHEIAVNGPVIKINLKACKQCAYEHTSEIAEI